MFDSDRAKMIAITEINTAQNLAALKAGYELQKHGGGKIKKLWTVGPDPCSVCEENNGEIVDLDEVFPSGHFAPSVHPNCMCEIQLITI